MILNAMPIAFLAAHVFFFAGPVLAQSETVRQGEEAFVDSLLALMTLEEKLGQLNQYRGEWGDTGPIAPAGGEEQIRAGKAGSFLSIYGAEYNGRLQRIAVEESRLGIPVLFAHDVIHGFRTIFPMPLALASSFDVDLVQETARIAAEEASSAGVHWTFAPMVDLSREPRWGRIVEGFGEDPLLASMMAAANVRGFQGEDLAAPNTILATAKHFVAYGGAEGGRDYNTVDISKRTLRETYLPPFEAAVKAGVQSIMPAFNEIAGVPMHAHAHLINDVLREEWGFDGVVVSDYTGVMELIPHGVAADRTEAGILGLKAGVDIDMVSGIYLEDMPEAVRAGRIPESTVDESVKRVLRAKYRLGLFHDPYKYNDAEREQQTLLHRDHLALAREAARRSIILLKNEGGVLPLSGTIDTLAVIGPLADHRRATLGGWAAAGRAEEATSLLDGIKEAVGSETAVVYAKGSEITGEDRSGFDEAVAATRSADAAILFVGEHHDMSSEAHNRTSIDLPGVQRELVQAVAQTGVPVIAVLVNGRPLSIPWLDENVPAILETWFLGSEMAGAVADVLFGEYNPGGKLPVTFPRTVGQVPIYYNHKNTGRPPDPQNKYTSKYIDVPWTPLYPFGHGLSYTTFEYSDLELSNSNIGASDNLTVAVTVTNTGSRAGDEVVQLYLRDEVASFTPAVRELHRFERISLAPGQTQQVRFTLHPDDFSILDENLEPVVEPGFFTVYVGTSSAEGLEARFRILE